MFSLIGGRGIVAFIVIFCLGVFAYLRSLSAPFYFDDFPRIAENVLIKHFTPGLLWKSDPTRFITNFSFNLNFLLTGFDLFPWHAVNLAIHMMNAWGVFLLTNLTFQTPQLAARPHHPKAFPVALLTALIFLLHPVQTQAVIYLVQRSTLLSAFFYIGTIYFYARARVEKKDRFYGWAVVLAFIGMFTKPTFMTLPLAIALYDFCFFGFDRKIELKHSLIYFLLALPLIIIPFLAYASGILMRDITDGLTTAGFLSHFLTGFQVMMTFLRLLILPIQLNLDYDYPLAHSLFDLPTLLSVAAIVLLVMIGCKMFHRNRLITFCIFWFFIALGAHVSILPLKDVIYEHWLYLSAYGFCFFLALLLWQVCRQQRIYFLSTAVLAFILCIMTFQRSALWADPVAFWHDVAAKSPRKARVYNNLGAAYRRNGNNEEAQKIFIQVLGMDPAFYEAQMNLADIYLIKKDYEKAKAILEEVEQNNPRSARVTFALGSLYSQLGDREKAFFYFEKTQLLNPQYIHLYTHLGSLYAKEGNWAMAKEALLQALWLTPENADLYYHLGNANFELDLFAEALTNYQEAVRKNPNSPEIHHSLANTLYAMGEIAASKKTIRTALELYRRQGRIDAVTNLENRLNALAN